MTLTWIKKLLDTTQNLGLEV